MTTDDGHEDGDEPGDGHGHEHEHDGSDDHEHDGSDDHEHEHGDHEHEHGDHEHEHGEYDDDHHHHDLETIGAAVLTISSSRKLEEDPAGDAIAAALEAESHEVVTRDLVRDDYDSIQGTVQRLVSRDDTDVVVTTGGTGITPDDVTVEAIRPLLEKHLPGFGELFRTLSRDEIGTKVVGTRATAGVADGVPVFCLPGSENAARLGAEDIIVQEAPHLAGLARRDDA